MDTTATVTDTRIMQRAALLLTLILAVMVATTGIAAGQAIHRGPLLSPDCPSCSRGHGGVHQKAMRPRPVPVVEGAVTALNPQLIPAGGHDRTALAPALPPNPIKPPHATVTA